MILQGTPATLSVTVSADGTPVALSNNGTVTVRDELGAEVASGNGTSGGTGIVTFTLTPTHTALVTPIDVEWAGLQIADGAAFTMRTCDEIVGELLFTEAEARAYDKAKLGDADLYPDSAIVAARDAIAERFEEILGWPVGRRFRVEVVDGDGGSELWLPKAMELASVRSVETRVGSTWTALSSEALADIVVYPSGRLVRESLGPWPTGMRNVRVGYEAGKRPMALRDAGLRVLRDRLMPTNIPDRALRMNDETGSYDLVVPGGSFGHWFGIPSVDQVLKELRGKVPVAY